MNDIFRVRFELIIKSIMRRFVKIFNKILSSQRCFWKTIRLIVAYCIWYVKQLMFNERKCAIILSWFQFNVRRVCICKRWFRVNRIERCRRDVVDDIADASSAEFRKSDIFIFIVDVVVKQLWRYSAVRFSMRSDMKAARNGCRSQRPMRPWHTRI